MDERTIQRLKPKNVQPEHVARMYERLREGLPDYTFSDEVVPFHSSYDDWHFFGKRKSKSTSLDPKSPTSTSGPKLNDIEQVISTRRLDRTDSKRLIARLFRRQAVEVQGLDEVHIVLFR